MPWCSRLPLRRPLDSGFTLVEVLLTVTILLVMFVAVAQWLGTIERAWPASAKDPFAAAQNAFDLLARQLATATLAPYQDYADTHGNFRDASSSASFVPDHIARRSDLAFVCGPASTLLTSRTTSGCAVFFLAPNGYTQTYAHEGRLGVVNAMGYLVEFGPDADAPLFTTASAPHWRLKQILQPAESLQIFTTGTSADWLQKLVPTGASLATLADNVITFLVLPEREAGDNGATLAPTFSYDSRDTTNRLTLHQLPPRARIVLVAIDDISATRLVAQNGANPPALVDSRLFAQAAQFDADLAALDTSLTTRKIGHRIFQREISLTAASWSNAASP